ncbi:MAG: DUF1127 domain-containing protein [Albidovulum sp.]
MNTTVIHTANAGITDRIWGFFTGLNESRQRYSIYRQTLRELSALSDRELNDLGLHNSMLEDVAMKAAYGK